MAQKERTLKIRDDIVLRKEEEGAFLFDPENGRLCYLNTVGIAILNMCRQPLTPKDITRLLCEQYPEEAQERVESDCTLFISELDRLGFTVP